MAEVFEAELAGDLGFVRKVAIKRMLETAAADANAARRFLDEAVIASRLHHANVVSVVDLGLLDDRPFQVLEYVDGVDAQQLLQRAGGKLPIEIALVIATAVAHALDHAHAACDPCGLPLGIVHRDVKPSNVLVSWSGDVKLGDFGIAIARDREATTEAGMVAGTAGFIAPEQRARTAIDGRTDVFALGLTLHALATGQSPFADLEIEIRSLAGDPVPIDPALPADVCAILTSALALERTARPTAGELASKLGVVLAPRLSGDSRSMLRDYLATLVPKPAPRVGALDALLGIEVVMAGNPSDELHRYQTRAASPRGLIKAATTDPDPTDEAIPPITRPRMEPDASSLARTHEQPRAEPVVRRRGPIIAAVLGASAVGGIAIWQLRGTSTVTPDAAIVAIVDAPRVEPDTAPPPDVSPDTVLVQPDASAPRDTAAPRDRSAPRDTATAVVASDAALPVGTGYVQVLGEDLIGSSVIIDRRNVGSVPNVFPVPYGPHSVEVLKKDGTRLPPKSIEVGETSNRANPLHPTW